LADEDFTVPASGQEVQENLVTGYEAQVVVVVIVVGGNPLALQISIPLFHPLPRGWTLNLDA
jgi:hypothetical protein